MLKRSAPAVLAILSSAYIGVASTPASAGGPQLLVDATSGKVLAASDVSASWHPASLTKIMTAHLALRAVEEGRLSMESKVVMSPHAAGQPPSKLGLAAGGSITLKDALEVMLVKSANDVAVAVAETIAGSEDAFARIMTEEARRLGMTATRYVNASGLHDPRQVSTARDLAVLALAVLRQHPEHARLFSISQVNVAGKTFRNTNGLLGRYPGADGMKTGYICASGFNVITTATRGGRKLLAVVLGEASSKNRDATTSKLLDFGFTSSQDGEPISSYAISSVSPAADLRNYGCGKSWKGGKQATARKTSGKKESAQHSKRF